MKAAVVAVAAAFGASACCIGPVVFALFGAGSLGAAAVQLEPYRPWFIALTVASVAAAFYGAYRTDTVTCEASGECAPSSRAAPKVFAWIAAMLGAVLIAFPYYVGWFI